MSAKNARQGRGMVREVVRGRYAPNATNAVRERIIRGDDWAMMAEANSVKKSTAYNWVRNGRFEVRNRGGAREVLSKINQEHINFLLENLTDNCQLTLRR